MRGDQAPRGHKQCAGGTGTRGYKDHRQEQVSGGTGLVGQVAEENRDGGEGERGKTQASQVAGEASGAGDKKQGARVRPPDSPAACFSTACPPAGSGGKNLRQPFNN